MDWQDERYVRLFTRDTPDWCSWPWQARALLPLLMRKVDRVGQLGMGRQGVRGVSACVGLPEEICRVGLEALVEDGCVEIEGQVIWIKNFQPAQEASMSGPARLREYRERKRAKLLESGGPEKRNETKRNEMQPLPSVPSVPSVETIQPTSTTPRPQLELTPLPPPPPKDEPLPEEAVLWNEVAAEDFGRVATINETRRKKLRTLRKSLPDLEAWRRAILRLNAWPWAHGQNDTGWKAGFDYLLSNDKHGNSNLIALAEGAKGGEKVQDVTRGFQAVGDYWDTYDAKANGGVK